MKEVIADISRIVRNGDLHHHFKWLQPPTTIDTLYQGYPAKRDVYPIYLEINCGVLHGSLVVWKEYEYPYVVIANSLGGEPFKARGFNLRDILPKIEKYLKG